MIGRLTAEVAATVAEGLAAGEELLGALNGPGACLVLTDRRLLIVRLGRYPRPRSGISSWPVDRDLRIHPHTASQGGRNILIEHDQRSAGFLVSDEEWPAALELVALAQRLSRTGQRT